MTLLSNAHPWCFFEVLCTEGGPSLWIFTWACSCLLCFTRRPQNNRNGSSCPPGTWRSLALMPRQRWAMVRCIQSTFWVGWGSASSANRESPPRVGNGISTSCGLSAGSRFFTHTSLGVDIALVRGNERLYYHRDRLSILFHGSPSVGQEFVYWVVFPSSLELCRICLHVESEPIFFLHYTLFTLLYYCCLDLAQIPEETQTNSTCTLWLASGKWIALYNRNVSVLFLFILFLIYFF